MRKSILLLSVLTVSLVASLLISGSSLLTVPFIEDVDMPVGTILTWFGLICLSTAFLASSEPLWQRRGFSRWYAYALIICLVLSTFWGLSSFSQSGKWNFTFSRSSPTFVGSAEAGKIFWMISKTTASAPILIYLVYRAHRLFSSSPK
jgi:hypothetical protein